MRHMFTFQNINRGAVTLPVVHHGAVIQKKNMYGIEWRETNQCLIPFELNHEVHI